MRIRLLARAEPYSSYPRAEEAAESGFLFVCDPGEGLAAVDSGREAELLVLPAQDFLSLAPEERAASRAIAYGAATLMEACFAAGCLDYLREPWPLAELLARARRLAALRFRALGRLLELRGQCLLLVDEPRATRRLGELEARLLVLLLSRPRAALSREALGIALWGGGRPTGTQPRAGRSRALDCRAGALRRSLDSLVPGAGSLLRARRGFGYSLEVDVCG